MKRIVALAVALVLLAGCGAAGAQDSTSEPAYTTIPSASTDHPDPRYLSCVASLPEDNIYLYSDTDNMLLFQEGHVTAFQDWGYEHYGYPQIAYFDIDSDGEKELAAVTIVGGGTGLCLTALHILKVIRELDTYHEAIYYKEFSLTNKDVTAYFDKNLKHKLNKQANTVEINIGDQSWTCKLNPELTWQENVIHVGATHVEFSFENNGIRLRAWANVWFEEISRGMAPGIGGFTANVTFDGEQISLTNIEFEPSIEENS